MQNTGVWMVESVTPLGADIYVEKKGSYTQQFD